MPLREPLGARHVVPALLCALMGVGLFGCDSDLLSSRTFACDDDGDCLDGYVCVGPAGEATCVPTDLAIDAMDADDGEQDTGDSTTDSQALDTVQRDQRDDADAPDDTDTTDTDDTRMPSDLADSKVTDTKVSDTVDVRDTADARDQTDQGDQSDQSDTTEPMRIDVTSDVLADTTWEAPHTYVLTKPIYVRNYAVLTIEAGVTVLGETADSDPAGALVVLPESELVTLGTASAPVVFTSAEPAGQRAAGDWHGVALLGDAPLNTADGTGYFYWFEDIIPDMSWLRYGGSDNSQSCGSLTYTRIEFAGYESIQDDYLPGLFLGGCGSSTAVDHVQVHRSGGNNIVLAGGSAPVRYIVSTYPFWTPLVGVNGWTGSAQFVVGFVDSSGDASLTAQTDYADPTLTPATKPHIYNATFAGSNWRALHYLMGSQGLVVNSVVVGQDNAVVLTDPATIDHAIAGDLDIRTTLFDGYNNLVYTQRLEDCGIWVDYTTCTDPCGGDATCISNCRDSVSGDSSYSSVFGGMTQAEIDMYFDSLTEPWPTCSAVLAFDGDAWLQDGSRGNLVGVSPGFFDANAPDGLYATSMSSPIVGAAESVPANDVHGVALDGSATWIGAFEPTQTPWSDGWTAYPSD